MSPGDYQAIDLATSITFSGAAVLSGRRAGNQGLWICGLAGATLLFGLGYLDWQRQVSRETPLITYVLLATVQPLLAVVMISWLAKRKTSCWAQWAASAFVFAAASIPIILLGMVAADFVPMWLR